MPSLRLLATSACTLSLLGCAGDEVLRTTVGTTDFCVPKRNAIEPTGWINHATRHLPNSGFAFLVEVRDFSKLVAYTPSLSARGDPLPITGVVDVEASGMIDRPPANHHWVVYATAPGAQVLLDRESRTLTAFEDQTRAFWVIWQIAEGGALSPQALPQSARVLASCRRTVFRASSKSQIQESTSCRRTIAVDGFRISYSFGEPSIGRLPELDAAVVKQVKAWRCARQNAA
jgi:hypothetical protein